MTSISLNDARYIDNENHRCLFLDLHAKKMANPEVAFSEQHQQIYDLMLLRIQMKKNLDRDLPQLYADADQLECDVALSQEPVRQREVKQVSLENPDLSSIAKAKSESRYCCLLGVAAAVALVVGIALCVLNVMFVASVLLMTLSIALIFKGGMALALVCMLR